MSLEYILMASINEDKLICGRTAREYLGCTKAEFESLVDHGLIQAYRDEYMRWKVSLCQVTGP